MSTASSPRSSSRGSCDSDSSPKTRSNSGVVRYRTAPPAPSSRPASEIRPRSTRPATTESTATPRMRAISGRLTGPRYATIASVSRAAGESPRSAGRSNSRPHASAASRDARKAQPPATCSRTIPLRPSEHRSEAQEKPRHRRKAQLQVSERDRRRLGRQRAQDRRQPFRLLRREPPLYPGRQRRGAEPEEPVALSLQPLREPGGGLLRAPVLRQPPRQLFRRLLGLELGQLGLLVGEEATRLQLEERRDQHEELPARLEIELTAFGESL